ncbi:aspartate carbamoyltransferase [Herbaspirillum sp. GCM10030257]|uniref:aspartate carbamoyltransferase n=1 Tax=Herbaspirillum sp. GCM10030257 TaxID=3273393 RepID=UPI00361BD657
MKRSLIFVVLAAAVPGATVFAQHATSVHQRQAEVAQRGADVMPFDLAATTHIFTKTKDGGIQRVITKRRNDNAQVKLVRQHLRDIQQQFKAGDFSGPSHIHGQNMPGLSTLREARPGQISISYRDIKGGAELQYHTAETKFTAALHQWFDAQLSDHGNDATDGNRQLHHHHGQHRR